MLACLGAHLFKPKVKERWTPMSLNSTATIKEPRSVPKHDVHLYAVLRFTLRGVEAESMEEACKRAEQVINNNAIKTAMRGDSEYETDFAEEIIEALVDLSGDESHSESTWLEPEGDAWVKKE